MYEDHFGECWDAENATGNFGKQSGVPDKLSNCTTSLYSLASHQGIILTDPNAPTDQQRSVSQWCEQHYPNNDLHDKTLIHIKMLAQICVQEGLEKERAIALLKIVFDTPDLLDPATAHRNNLAILHNYATNMGINQTQALDKKMAEARPEMDGPSAGALPNRIEKFDAT